MQTVAGSYINSNIIELLFKKDEKYYTSMNDEIHELANILPDTFKHLVFIPGNKLVQTIETADADKVLTLDGSIKYLEREKDVTYFINIKNIALFEKLKENVVHIWTIHDNYLFEILPENMNKFESRLVY